MNTYHELAEAMRKGAALRPQAFGRMFTYRMFEPVDSCALGALYEGAAGTPDGGTLEDIEKLCVPAIQSMTRYPDSGQWGYLPDVIAWLNDKEHWTREAIADWLDTL